MLDQLAQIHRNPFYMHFHEGLSKPMNLLLPTWKRKQLSQKAMDLIENQVLPSFTNLESFLRDHYMIGTRRNVGLSSLKNGREIYRRKIRYYTDSDSSPEEIHDLALRDMDKLKARIQKVNVILFMYIHACTYVYFFSCVFEGTIFHICINVLFA